MEDVIREIIKIEDAAQKLMKDTKEEIIRKREEHKKDVQSFEEEILGDARRKVEQIREKELAEIQQVSQEKINKCDTRLNKMAYYVDKNEERWVLNLINSVLEG